MKDKHIHIAEDSELLKKIYKQADALLPTLKHRLSILVPVKLVFFLSVMALCYYGIMTVPATGLFILCFVAFGVFTLLFAFNFAHDFSHNTIFKSKAANNLGFIFIYTMNGAHAEAWKMRHVNSHHYAPNVEDYDSDLNITSLIRVLPGSKHSWYHRFQHVYAPLMYTSYSLYWIFIKDFAILFSKEDWVKNKGVRYHSSFWTQKVFYLSYLLLLPLLFSPHSWYVVLFAFLAMHLVQSLFLLFTFFMTHHVESTEYPSVDDKGYINASWLMNQVKSSNDMHPFSHTANFILGGFNNHIAHHLFPHVHHVYYPELSKLLYNTLEENNISPNKTSYWGGIVSHLRFLRKMSIR